MYEIDVFDSLMRDMKHLTTNTPKDKMNTSPDLVEGREVDRLHARAGQGD